MITENGTKHWAIWDTNTQELVEMTHDEFKQGLENNWIKLRGEFKSLGNRGSKIWIDGVLK